jgi:hypothetical protein
MGTNTLNNKTMKATIISTEQIRNCETRAYNPSEWDRAIDRFLKFQEVKFYHVPKGDGYDYDRYYAEYLLPEGLRLFNSVSYSSTLCNSGFGRVDIANITEDGKTFSDLLDLVSENKMDEAQLLADKLKDSKLLDISFGYFHTEKGEEVLFGTTPEARRDMIRRCKISSTLIFSKGF